MFCSNCGKTVKPGDQVCPHCHMALGDVRFEGIPYTSVQFRIVPGTPMPIDEAYSYTRTNYSVNIGEGQAPEPVVDDVDEENLDSATTYRPTLRSDEAMEEPEEAYDDGAESGDPDAAPVDVVDPEDLTEEQINKVLDGLKKRGLDADELTQTEPEPEPEAADAEDAGRSERMEAYESEMRADQERRQQKASRGKLKIPFVGKKKAYDGLDDADEAYSDQPYDADGPAYDAGYEQSAPDYEAEAGQTDSTEEGAVSYDAQPYDEYGDGETYDDSDERRGVSLGGFMNATVAGIRVANILKVAGGLVVVVICLVLGLKWFGYVNDAQQKSPIEGVTLALYDNGIEAITSNASTENITELLSTYTNDGIVAFTAAVEAENAELQALLPSEPGVNDQLFVQALASIEANIANAVTLDGISGTSGSAESTARWAVINQSISSLKAATSVAELQAIVNADPIDTTIAEATPSPTPVTYQVLTSGASGDDVLKLQQRLYDLGYLTDTPDGAFGKKTTTAVKYFQMAHDLTVSGIADSAMQELLFSDEAMDVQTGLAAYQARQNGTTLAPTATPAPEMPAATEEAGA